MCISSRDINYARNNSCGSLKNGVDFAQMQQFAIPNANNTFSAHTLNLLNIEAIVQKFYIKIVFIKVLENSKVNSVPKSLF